MNWPRVKTILILALLVVNLFLGYNIWVQNRAATELPKEMAKTAAQLLADRGLLIDADSIPLVRPSLPALRYTVDTPSITSLALEILEDSSDSVINTDENGETIIASSEGSIRLWGQNAVEYTAAQNPRTAAEPGDARRIAERLLLRLGMTADDFRIAEIREEETQTVLQVSRLLLGYEVFDHGLTVTVSGDRVVRLTGRLLPAGEGYRQEVDNRDAVNVLFSIVENQDFFDSLSSKELIRMDYGFTGGAGTDSVGLYPSWRLTDKNGKCYYYESATGRFFSS